MQMSVNFFSFLPCSYSETMVILQLAPYFWRQTKVKNSGDAYNTGGVQISKLSHFLIILPYTVNLQAQTHFLSLNQWKLQGMPFRGRGKNSTDFTDFGQL